MATYRSLILACMLAANGVAGAGILLDNVRGYTPTADGIREFTMLFIGDDGRILATDDSLLSIFPPSRRIDGNGRFVLPGLTDAHAHVYSLGFLAISLDLAGAQSVDDAVVRIARYAAANPHARWIQGRGWNQVLWPVKEFPVAADIDAVVADRPVWLRRVDGHAAWANSEALAVAGIDKDTLDPIGGKILRDRNGDATGILIDRAMNLVESKIPAPSRAEIRTAYETAIRQLISLGVTGVHDAGIDLVQAAVLIDMANDGALDLRIYAMLDGADEVLDGFGEPIREYGGDRLDIAAVKLYADGALGSRGAALIEPYSDDAENHGLPFWTTDELLAMTRRVNERGYQAAIHAIGDRGNRLALDAFAQVQGGRPSPFRNRVEHAQIIALEDIPRFAELGVIASMQPTHATSDMNMAEDRVGPERIRGGYAWRRLLDSGAVIASGSDFPVELANPFHGLYAAVTRRDRAGLPEGGWYREQAMTRAEALRSFTLDAAYAAHQERRLGSLEPGKWADFIVIDRDYFAIPAAEIDDIRVLETWVGGERVYHYSERTEP